MSIKCPHCNHDNPPDSLFCEECGFKLPQVAAPAAVHTPSAPSVSPSILYTLTIRNNVIEVSEPIKTFGRQDFMNYIPESEYKYISRKQFTIFKENEKFFIQDGGEEDGKWKYSTNGTKLNGLEIKGAGKKELKDNDKILVADTIELVFNIIKK